MQLQYGPVVQLVRTPACHAGGRGFEPLPDRHFLLESNEFNGLAYYKFTDSNPRGLATLRKAAGGRFLVASRSRKATSVVCEAKPSRREYVLDRHFVLRAM